MSLKRLVPVLVAAGLACSAAAANASHYVQLAANNDYYTAYYDGHYGPITDGYWGRDGKFWYEDRSDNWHEDDGTPFQRDPADGFKHVQGSGGQREH